MAISCSVTENTAQIIGMPAESIGVDHNPMVTPDLESLASIGPDHPWLHDDEDTPVIFGVGRLVPQKDFPNLIRAFALASKATPCRLIILGEGASRPELQTLANELGVGGDLAMPGFVKNRNRYMRAAALFVHASRWVGSPNGLTDASAIDTPKVATNCPDGTNAMLQEGKYGPGFMRSTTTLNSVSNSARENIAAPGLPEHPDSD